MTIKSANKPRIYADFTKTDGNDTSEWLILKCKGTFDDLARLGIAIREGLEAIFYMDDGDDRGNYDELQAEGTVRFDAIKNHWIAIIDWNTIQHASGVTDWDRQTRKRHNKK